MRDNRWRRSATGACVGTIHTLGAAPRMLVLMGMFGPAATLAAHARLAVGLRVALHRLGHRRQRPLCEQQQNAKHNSD